MIMFGEQAGLTIADPEGEYVSVELRLFPPDGLGTPAELSVSGLRRDFARVHVPLDREKLAKLAKRAYGEELGRQLFENTQLGEQLTELRTVIDAKGARWRFRLRLEDPSLEALQWERLCVRENDVWAPIGSAADRPFSRYVPVTDWKPATPITKRPINVLLVYASPANLAKRRLPPIAAVERDAIRAAIEESALEEVRVEELSSDGSARPTLAVLREALTREPEILHVLCHGISGPDGSGLVLEREDGEAEVIDAALLRDAVRGSSIPPRLVVLSACESAAPSAAEGFVSLGSLLSRDCVDSVLAMSEAVTIDTARAFCASFYRRLFVHGVLDRAVNEARAAVRDNIDWGVPVLFARMRDCQLLDFASPAQVEAGYLGISNRVIRTVATARAFGHEHAANDIIGATNELIKELEKGHKILTGVTGNFRKTGSDPATFPGLFEAFRLNFKDYYDHHHWESERTHCHEVQARAQPALPLFKRALPKREFEQLKQDLEEFGESDVEIIHYLAEFLDLMDDEVDKISKLLRQKKVAEAIAKKLAFEDQISPTFRRSKALLIEIAERSHAIHAA